MALDPLATPDEIVARLGRELSSAETERAVAILDDASAAVRNYTHRTFTLVEDDVVRSRVRNGQVRLPHAPIVSVSAAHALNYDGTVGTALAGWYFDGFESLVLASSSVVINGPYRDPHARRTVQVTYTHGYEEIPAIVTAIVCSVALRALGRQPLDGGMSSESIDGYSYTVGSTGAAGPIGLLPDERAQLDNGLRAQGGSVLLRP